MTLRMGVAIAAALVLVAGTVLAVLVHPAYADLAVAGAVVLLGVLLEARRYRTRGGGGRRWELTDEKFVDPTTGHMMQVRFDPQSGERDYVDLGPRPPSGS